MPEDTQLESYAERHPEIGQRLGEIRTLRRGHFGDDGERVRSALHERALLWEQNGYTIAVKLMTFGIESHG